MGKMKELAMEEQQRQMLGPSPDAGFEINQLRKESHQKLDAIMHQLVEMRLEMVDAIIAIDDISKLIKKSLKK